MAQPFGSALSQSIGATGYVVLSWADPARVNDVSVSFLPTLIRMTNPQPAPLQKINISVGGAIHIFQYSPNELLTWQLDVIDLPWDQRQSRFLGHPTDGMADLQSFIRTTLNYTANPVTIVTADGFVETMRYLKGLDTFREAAGNTQRANFFTGTLTFQRLLA